MSMPPYRSALRSSPIMREHRTTGLLTGSKRALGACPRPLESHVLHCRESHGSSPGWLCTRRTRLTESAIWPVPTCGPVLILREEYEYQIILSGHSRLTRLPQRVVELRW